MNRVDAMEQYSRALAAGKKYYKTAVSRGENPYPAVLDEILDESRVISSVGLGTIDIPANLIAGTKSEGRMAALAGNFMPLLDEQTEFGSKWISLCSAHLSDEGIRDPISCCEYLGKFYIVEGNKRASVLMSYGSPVISAEVTRLVPEYSDDHDIQVYYEFMRFYELSGIYDVSFKHRGRYTRLQSLLGFAPDHVWTAGERRRFRSSFQRFNNAYLSVCRGVLPIPAPEALLVWLGVFSYQDIWDLPAEKLASDLAALMPDIRLAAETPVIEVSTEPETAERNFISKILSPGRPNHVTAAFIYAFSPEVSPWTRSHEHGRCYVGEKLGERIVSRVYDAFDGDYSAAMEKAVDEGADVIFATTPTMIDACRRTAALHSGVKVFNCSLSMPYSGVKSYYGRLHECKFITGLIAGAMAENDVIGYIANYPILGTNACINAFALGARATNPRARIKLMWSCLPGNPFEELKEQGISVISNRDATNSFNPHWALEWGTYKINSDGSLLPLAVPCWDWGRFYERVVSAMLNGVWLEHSPDRPVNYWWGMDTGIIDIQLSDSIPGGVRSLAEYIRLGITDGRIDPFMTHIEDQSGKVMNDGTKALTPDEIMHMDWLCLNVDGSVPEYERLIPKAQELVRVLGVRRDVMAI